MRDHYHAAEACLKDAETEGWVRSFLYTLRALVHAVLAVAEAQR
jgi:hypothetical protein